MASPYVSVSCSYTENSTDIVNNRSNVTVKLNFASVDGGYANDSPNYWLKVWGPDGTEIGSLSGTQNFSAGQSFTLCTWTGNVTHDENGKGNIQYQGYFQGAAKPDPGVTTQKYSQPLTSLPRASELTNGTTQRAIDRTMSFGVDKKIDTATDKLTLKSGTVSSVVSTNYATGTIFSLSTATVNSLEKLNTTGTSVSMIAQIETIVSGTTIGTNTYAFTGTFTAPTPTWTSPSVGSYSITGVQNHNTVTVKYGGTISGVNNASIESIKYTIGSQVSTVTTISNSASFTNISVKDVTIQAFDGRGASVISTFVNAISTMSSYTEPTFDIDSVRRNPTMLDTGAVIEFSGTKNSYETTNISGYYRQGGSSATTAISAGYINKSGAGTGTTSYTGTVTFPTGKFDIDKDYIVTLIANDQYTTQNKEVTITKANVAMDIDLTNNRVAVGQLVPTSTSGTGSVPSNSLTVYGKIFTGGNEVAGFEVVSSTPSSADYSALLNIIYPIGSVYLSLNNTNPSNFFGGTWEQIAQGRTLFGAGTLNGNTYTAGSTVNAGLPEIEGTVNHLYGEIGADTNFTGAFYRDTNIYFKPGFGTAWQSSGTGFKASLSNSIYGSSDTVQPPAFVVYMWRRTA